MQKRKHRHFVTHRPTGKHSAAKQTNLKASREKSPDTSVHTGREKDCGADISISCQARRVYGKNNRRHCNHDGGGSLGRDLKIPRNQIEI